METPLEVNGLSVSYSGRPVLWNVTVSFPRGCIAAVAGPNGAGKTTLVRAVQNLVPKTSGKVLFFGRPYSQMRKSVAYVPQTADVDWNFPASVADVVQMGTYMSLGWIRRPGKRERDKTRAALEKTGMEKLAGRQIGELSGGQRQRVFVARALVQDADLYLMDEPFAGVDKPTEEKVAEIMRQMRDCGKTVVAVHHDLATLPRYFDRVIFLNGRVVAGGDVSDVFTRGNISLAYGSVPDVLRRQWGF